MKTKLNLTKKLKYQISNYTIFILYRISQTSSNLKNSHPVGLKKTIFIHFLSLRQK